MGDSDEAFGPEATLNSENYFNTTHVTTTENNEDSGGHAISEGGLVAIGFTAALALIFVAYKIYQSPVYQFVCKTQRGGIYSVREDYGF